VVSLSIYTHAKLFLVPTKPFVDFNHNLFSLNQSFLNTVDKLDKSCGYKAYREKYMTFPPPGPLPGPPNQYGNVTGCNIHSLVQRAAQLVNPCFDVYQVATTCPTLFDPLGFPGSFDFVPDGWTLYFARPDVQEVIHAPQIDWQECTGGVLRRDTSLPSGLSVLPGVIEKNKRTLIAHGSLDYILLANGTLMMSELAS
jgi:carboxypeptidase D